MELSNDVLKLQVGEVGVNEVLKEQELEEVGFLMNLGVIGEKPGRRVKFLSIEENFCLFAGESLVGVELFFNGLDFSTS